MNATKATEIGARIGQAIARDVLSDGLDREWTGLDAQDGDQLTAAGIEPGSEEWDAAEEAAEEAYKAVLLAAPHTFMASDDGGSTEELDAEDMDEAIGLAEEWCRGGDWGTGGASIPVTVREFDGTGEEVDARNIDVEIEPDHEAMIAAACGYTWDEGGKTVRGCGTDPDDHDWTSEGEGGCTENPGVWATGGTSMSFASHCRTCGLRRLECTTGSQRNPGEHDTVSYEMPDSCDCETAVEAE